MSPDDRLAAELATEAGRLLLGVRAEGLTGADLKAAGDKRSHDYLMAALGERAPKDGVLSEEGADDQRRLTMERVWIVDPLDGTREFSEPPRDDWAVHVALTIGGRVANAAVALPGRGRTLATGDELPAPSTTVGTPRLLVSRTRPTEHAQRLAAHLGAELVPMGSAGAKAMAVVLGEADIYAHSGGQYEWDSAAPVGVAAAAGFHVSRLDGSPIVYNRSSPWMPDLLICHPVFADQVIEFCKSDN
ncbi:MAG: 3'(2'),5'-bisphosphate nucleotidase CysQ [Acidimicrobiia bacterium]